MNWKKILVLTITFAILPSLVAVSFAKYQFETAATKATAEAIQNIPPAPPEPVAVEPEPAPAPVPPSNADVNEGPIDLSAEDYLRITGELKGLLDTQSPRVALARLEEYINSDKKVLRSCHGLAHAIGHWGYKKLGSFAAAMEYTDDVCGNGYMHGVIEENFVNVSDIVTTMRALCAPGQWGCFHGQGHGLMYYKENDLYAALPLCANLTDPTAQAYCAEGVYMENFETNSQVHAAKYLKPEDPFYPCADPNLGYKDACYYYSGRYIVRIQQDDYIGALKRCLQAPESQFSTTCARGVGAVTVRQNLQEPPAVEFICSQGPVNLVSSCLYGAVSYYSVNYQSAEYTRTNFCGKFNNSYYVDMCLGFLKGFSG